MISAQVLNNTLINLLISNTLFNFCQFEKKPLQTANIIFIIEVHFKHISFFFLIFFHRFTKDSIRIRNVISEHQLKTLKKGDWEK